nr:uncharacterized protein LOC105866401 isoform X2 [Microcebus murinus]
MMHHHKALKSAMQSRRGSRHFAADRRLPARGAGAPLRVARRPVPHGAGVTSRSAPARCRHRALPSSTATSSLPAGFPSGFRKCPLCTVTDEAGRQPEGCAVVAVAVKGRLRRPLWARAPLRARAGATTKPRFFPKVQTAPGRRRCRASCIPDRLWREGRTKMAPVRGRRPEGDLRCRGRASFRGGLGGTAGTSSRDGSQDLVGAAAGLLLRAFVPLARQTPLAR